MGKFSEKGPPENLGCVVSVIGRGLVGHRLDTTCAKVLKLCYQMTTKADLLLEDAKVKLNSVALARERTIPTERPPPVDEVSANFCG